MTDREKLEDLEKNFWTNVRAGEIGEEDERD